MSDSLRPHGLQPARLLCSWNCPGKNTGLGCHSLLHGIFPDPGIEPASPALAVAFFATAPPGKLNWRVRVFPMDWQVAGGLVGRGGAGNGRQHWTDILPSAWRDTRQLWGEEAQTGDSMVFSAARGKNSSGRWGACSWGALCVVLRNLNFSVLVGCRWNDLSRGLIWLDLHVKKIAVGECLSNSVLRNVPCKNTVNGNLVIKWTRTNLKRTLTISWKGNIKMIKRCKRIKENKSENILSHLN